MGQVLKAYLKQPQSRTEYERNREFHHAAESLQGITW